MASLPQESTTAGWLPGGGRRGVWRSRESRRPALGLLPARRAAVASQRLISGSDRARPRQPAARWARPRCSARRRAFGTRP